MSLAGKRVAVFLEKEFDTTEALYPLLRLREEEAEVLVVGTGSMPTYKARQGFDMKVDTIAREVVDVDFDCVIVPGGWAPDKLRQSQEVLTIVRRTYQRGHVVAAICHGPWVLISAGVTRGRRVASYPGIQDDVRNSGAEWVDAPVMVDGNLITARRPEDTSQFCARIIAALRTP